MGGHIVFSLSVCLCVCKNFYIGHSFLMVSDRASIFHIYIPWGKTLSLVPKSRSNIKVTVFRKSGCCGRHSCFTNTSCFPWGLSLMPYSCQLFLAHLSTTCSRGAFRVVMCLSCVINNFFKHLLPNCWGQFGPNLAGMFLRSSSSKIVHRILFHQKLWLPWQRN